MLSRSHVLALTLAVVVTGWGWAQGQQPQPGTPEPTPPRVPGNPGAVPPPYGTAQDQLPLDPLVQDKKFVKDAAEGAARQVELGRLAQEKGSSEAVKEFGKRMVEDRTRASEELQQAAAQAKIPMPSLNEKKIKKIHDKFAKLSGPDFDRAYAKMMISEHKDNVKEFESEAKVGQSPEVRAFAVKMLPAVRAHQKLAERLGGGGSTDSADRKAR